MSEDARAGDAGRIAIGQIYVDAKPPRRKWRVTEAHGDHFTVERVDQAGAFRFLDAVALGDRNRYRKKR